MILLVHTSTIVNIRQLGWSQDRTLDSHATALPQTAWKISEPPTGWGFEDDPGDQIAELGFDERNFWDASVDEIGSYVGPSITTQNKLKPTTINHIY